MTKVDWIADGVLILPSSIGLVNDQKGGMEFATFTANWKREPAALTNNKQENVDQIQTDNVIKRSSH